MGELVNDQIRWPPLPANPGGLKFGIEFEETVDQMKGRERTLRKPPSCGILFLAVLLLFPAIAFAAGEDPSIPLLLYLVVILVTAKLMGHLALVLGQPAVLVTPPLLKWTLTDRRIPDSS